MRRLLAVALATLALAVGVALPAAAQTADPNTGSLIYEGAVTYQSMGSHEYLLEIACSGGACQLDFERVYTFFDGLVAEEDAGSLDCNESGANRPWSARLTLTPETLTGTVSQPPRDVSECPGFAAGTVLPGEDMTFDLAYVSGETCLIDASCTAAAVGADLPGFAAGPGRANPAADYAPGGERTFATPTAVSSVITLAEALQPANIAWAVGGTVVLGILVVIPSQFANSAADTLLGRFRERLRNGRMNPDAERPKLELRGWPWAAAGVLIASVIATLADPNFGFDAAGLRLLLSIVVTFAVEVVVGWIAVVLIVRRTHPDAVASFSFTPLSLAIVVGAVLLSRLSGFSPPIVFGLVAGVAFGGLLGSASKARVALIGLGWAFGIGLVAWVVYSYLPVDQVVVRELLGAAAIAGISTLPIALVPIRGLVGHTVWEWRKAVWLIAYAIGLFAFLLVLLPLPGAWTEVGGGLITWVVLFVVYAVVSIGLWLIVTSPWRKVDAT